MNGYVNSQFTLNSPRYKKEKKTQLTQPGSRPRNPTLDIHSCQPITRPTVGHGSPFKKGFRPWSATLTHC